MKRKIILFATLGIFSFFSRYEVFAQRGSSSGGGTVTVQLATFTPRNSDYGNRLEKMAKDWAEVTNNRVKLIIYHDGKEGGEQTTLSSVKSNLIQATICTSFGLNSICPAVMTLSAPFLIRSEAELDLVLNDDVKGLLENQVKKTDYVVLAWSKSGWVNIFSKEPITAPDDLRRQKMATNPEVPDFNKAFATMGFTLVDTDINSIPQKIASNSINAIYQSPALVFPTQSYKQLKNMMDVPIAPFMSAIVINKLTWNKISPEDQKKIRQVTENAALDLDTKMPKMVIDAVANMRKGGLSVNVPSPEQQELWYAEVKKALPKLLADKTFDPELYNKINEILNKARNGR